MKLLIERKNRVSLSKSSLKQIMNFNFLREMGVLERLSLRYNVKIATMEVVAMAMHSKNSLDFCDI